MVWPSLRRPSRRVAPLVVADVALDVQTGWLSVGGWTVRLTSREVQLLEQLMRQPGRVVGGDELASILQVDAAHVARSARRLRRRLMVNPLSPPPIEAVSGVGYRFLPAGPTDSEALRAEGEQSRGRAGGPSS